ncbi:MAG: TRAP transporter small permease subunit [Gammaproteobacteria bacterium]
MIFAEPVWITGLRHALTRMETVIAGISLLLLLALVFGQVLARNLVDSSIPTADVLSRYLVLYIAFFGAALAVDSHRHIKLDVVAAVLTTEQIHRIRSPLYLISSLVCGVFAWAAARFWYDDWQYVADNERWSSILALITPFGFGLLALNFLLSALFIAAHDNGRP